MNRNLRFANALLSLALLISPAAVGAQDAGGGRAYIWVGDINPAWYSLALRSAFGQVDPYKDLKPVIDAQRKKMEQLGYQVTLVETASAHEIEMAIKDPRTKAFAFFGHGDENVGGTLSTLSGDDITAGDIQGWAREALQRRLGKPESWKGLDPAERGKRKDATINAHFDLKYVYMHSCFSLKDTSLVDALISDDGEFRGFKGKAFLKDESEAAKNQVGRMESQLGALKERHRTLKVALDASGGHDATTSKEMTGVYREYLKLKADVDRMKSLPRAE